MPIPREQFQAGRIDLTLHIRKLLEDHHTHAFTAEEVLVELTKKFEDYFPLEYVTQVLEDLTEKEKCVEAKEIDGKRWYVIIEKELGFQ